ncbi:translation initiation factor IF-2 [Diplocloster agilis]|uniref:Translation initiation factor IF-2 n=1 Tax=Diplocloster agilis TaxID=2850323 RepID=A0A949NE92_9FIRM|nr:translation initiation factor IF-2 [Diplocloster agilis]MBU9736906.1 translation initiation factor IF-2 [Diplocloster agilis]
MAKLRVYELAKELGKESKDVLTVLASKNIEVKSHASSLSDEQVDMVRKSLSPKAQVQSQARPQSQVQRPSAPAGEATAHAPEARPQQEVPKKKPNIIQVYNPQNSQQASLNRQSGRPQAGRPGQNPRPQGQRPMGSQQGARPAQGQGQPGTRPVQGQPGTRPVQGQGQQGTRPVQGQGQPGTRPVQGQGQPGTRPVQGQGQPGTRPVQSQGQPGTRPVQGQGQQGTRPVQGQGQQQGTRPVQGQGQQGARPVQSQSQQGTRPAGQAGNQGVRPNGSYQGNQGQRPQGQQGSQNRPAGASQYNRPNGQQGNSSQRPAGNQQSYGSNRPYGQQNNNGNRNTAAGQGQRSGQGQYNRPAQGDRPNGRPNQGSGQYQNQGSGQYQRNSQGQGGQRSGQGQYGNRPYQGQNGRPQGQNNRSQGTRPGGAPSMRDGLTIPKPPQTKATEKQNVTSRAERGDRNDRSRDKDRNGRNDRRGYQDNRPNQRNMGGKGRNNAPAPKPVQQEPKEVTIRTIILPETMTIKELAEKMKVQAAAVVKKLFLQGSVVTVNQEIDFEKAEEIALEFNCIAEAEVKVDVIEELLKEEEEDPATLIPRPPVVCVMGHVDHGKTSLLDAIRNTHVIDKEAGGITQHIGAYTVSIDGQKITFLDTPGHEAFTAMRMRGANSTDIAILVVAADDGVMPQTIEAINHAKAAGIEIIVAINKIDKPSANIERVKQELTEYELIPEDWGGSTIFAPVSAHTHEGIDNLLEMILLTAEVCELKANPKRRARGLVIEAELDKGKGPVATVLVQKGTLHVGDSIAAGSSYGKVRAMMDDKGRRVKEAGPSTPVEILGLSDVPNAGDIFVSPENDKEARNFAQTFISEGRERLLEDTKAKMSLDDLFTQIKAGNVKELGIVVKADVQGSVEAVKQSLLKLSNEEVVVKIIHGGVGAINESDVILASASNAIIIGFNVRPDATAKNTAEREGVDMRLYRVIYDAIADVEAAMKGMLDPVFEEKVLGHAQVRQTFKASGVGTIAGAYILDGIFQRNCTVRLTRDGVVIYEGPLASLKRFKDDVKEVKSGFECGLVLEGFNDIKEEDLVEAYTMVEVPR